MQSIFFSVNDIFFRVYSDKYIFIYNKQMHFVSELNNHFCLKHSEFGIWRKISKIYCYPIFGCTSRTLYEKETC